MGNGDQTTISACVKSVRDWADALMISVASDQVPEGWKTIAQISKEIGRSISTTERLINRLHADGKCERQMFKVASRERTLPIAHYKLL